MIWKPRYSVLAVLFGAYLLCYIDRMAIATAIPFIAKDFDLSPLAMGGVLSAFFVGYALMQFPGGLLADRFGPNRVMVSAIAAWSIFTALTGVATSLAMLLVIRLAFGLCEGPYPPSASKAITMWFPRAEVGRANGLQLAAVQIGAALAPLLVTTIILGWGWRAVFFALLVPGFILAFLVWRIVKDEPVPFEERSASAAEDAPKGLPIKEVLRMPCVRWCAVTIFFWSIAAWGLMNWLPTYLLQARGFSVPKMGLLGSLPYLAGALGYYLGGHLCDRHYKERRHVPIMASLILAGGMTYWAAVAPTGEWAIAALILAFLCLFVSAGGIFTLPLVMVPQQAVGAAFGFVNTAAQIAAFLSPLLVGAVLSATGSNFTLVFYGFVGLLGVAALAAVRIGQVTPVRFAASHR